MMKRIGAAIIAFALVGALYGAILGVSVAHARGIRGVCGEHWGKLYRIDSAGARYKVRFGPKDGHVGGSHHCHGIVFLRRSGGASKVDGITGSWVSFDWLRWNLHTIIATNSVAASCVGFGLGVAAEAPTAAVSTWLTVSGGIGCATGTTVIVHNLISGGHPRNYCGATANHPICNARVRMR